MLTKDLATCTFIFHGRGIWGKLWFFALYDGYCPYNICIDDKEVQIGYLLFAIPLVPLQKLFDYSFEDTATKKPENAHHCFLAKDWK